MKNVLFALPFLILCACAGNPPEQAAQTPVDAPPADTRNDVLRRRLWDYVRSQQADTGLAMMDLEDGDTLSLNGDRYYSLMSVAKFPQALLLLHLVDSGKISMSQPLSFGPADLQQRTASTLRRDHPGSRFELSIPEALQYAVGQSDNITSNKIFEVEGGPAAVTDYVHSLGIRDVRIVADYGHMGRDSLHNNRATPLAMVRLLARFHRDRLLSDSSERLLRRVMTDGPTGLDRLKGGVPAGTEVAHKTGTSGTDSAGITQAFNDIGIVRLPDGRHFAIAVFVADSREPAEKNAAMIAHVCKEVWDHFTAKKPRSAGRSRPPEKL